MSYINGRKETNDERRRRLNPYRGEWITYAPYDPPHAVTDGTKADRTCKLGRARRLAKAGKLKRAARLVAEVRAAQRAARFSALRKVPQLTKIQKAVRFLERYHANFEPEPTE